MGSSRWGDEVPMGNRSWKSARTIIAATCFAWVVGGSAERVAAQSLASQGAIRTVALTGPQQAPGTPQGVFFSKFLDVALIGGGGQVAFHATLSNSGGPRAIWSETVPGALREVARSGDQAPGLEAGALFKSFSDFSVDAMGNVSYAARLRVLGPIDITNSTVLYSEGGGNGPQVIARAGDPAPGTPDNFNSLSLGRFPVLSSTGIAAFNNELREPGSNTGSLTRGIWSTRDGDVELVVLEGDTLPGIPTPTTIDNLRGTNPVAINPQGDVAFFGTVFPAFKTALIVEDRPLGFRLAAVVGDQAPGLATGVQFGALATLGFNGQGETAFTSTLIGTGVSSDNDRSIWSEAGGQLHLVAREGDLAPGVDAGLVFGQIANALSLSGNGTTTFLAPVMSGTTQVATGLWAESPQDGLRPIMLSGDAAPGTESLTIFDSVGGSGVDSGGRFNFTGSLSGPSVDDSNDRGLWSGFGRDDALLLARKGDLLEVAPGDFRTIERFGNISTAGFPSSSGLEDGRRAVFNDLKEAVFTVSFTDGTEGVLVVTVPEPASWTIFAVLGIGFLIIFRRHQ